jgi:hypothetical protein
MAGGRRQRKMDRCRVAEGEEVEVDDIYLLGEQSEPSRGLGQGGLSRGWSDRRLPEIDLWSRKPVLIMSTERAAALVPSSSL